MAEVVAVAQEMTACKQARRRLRRSRRRTLFNGTDVLERWVELASDRLQIERETHAKRERGHGAVERDKAAMSRYACRQWRSCRGMFT